VAGATAAVGSSVVKVPLAVCIRSVQAGLHPNAVEAARSIVQTAGARSLFTVCCPPHRSECLQSSLTASEPVLL
jgi:solute carrier family 25 S-adenosylmethionine transporter 26